MTLLNSTSEIRPLSKATPSALAGTIRPVKLRAPNVLLSVALVASAALLLSFDSHLTFIGDDWDLLIGRQGWHPSTFLEPYNENLILGPAVLYRILLTVFGMDSSLPFYVVSIALFLLCAVLLFVHLRPRVGEWLAMFAAVLVLFLGAAYEDLFWAFQMGFFGSIAAGLGALLALDRDDRRGDQFACGLLLASLAFGSVGIAFVAAGLADLALGRRPRGKRAYVTLLPLAAYALWWLGWGQTAGSQMSVETLVHLPRYVFDAAAAGIASLLGREAMAADGHPPVICQVLLVVLLLVAGLRTARERELPRGLVIALALALAFWVLIGLNRTAHDRFALSSRYQYPSAVFILLIAAELVRGVRIPRVAIGAMAVITAGAVAGGISIMHRQHSQGWESLADQTRLTVSAVDIARPSARPAFPVSFPPSVSVPAQQYLSASERYGSPGYSETELLARPGPERQDADRALARVLGIALARPGSQTRQGRCQTIIVGGTRDHRGVGLLPGRFTLANTGTIPATLRLGRFAGGSPVALGRVLPGAVRSLAIPGDASNRRWKLAATGSTVRLCAVKVPARCRPQPPPPPSESRTSTRATTTRRPTNTTPSGASTSAPPVRSR